MFTKLETFALWCAITGFSLFIGLVLSGSL